MGGIVILVAFTLTFLKFSAIKNTDFYVLLVATLGFGLIGFLDDYIKIVFKRSLGLTARQKLFGQLLFGAIMCWLLLSNDHSTAIGIPGTSWSFDWGGWFYYPFIIIMMLAISNAVNFTDGLDECCPVQVPLPLLLMPLSRFRRPRFRQQYAQRL